MSARFAVVTRSFAVLLIVVLIGSCAPIEAPTPTPRAPATPHAPTIDRAIAAAEARAGFRASLPSRLPPGSQVSRVALVNEQPPTVDIEYLLPDSRQFLLRQRPVQSNTLVPEEATRFVYEGLEGRALVQVDSQGRFVRSEVYWVGDGMEYVLTGVLTPEELASIARGVARPVA